LLMEAVGPVGLEKSAASEVEELVLEEVPTCPPRTSVVSTTRSRGSRNAVELRTSTGPVQGTRSPAAKGHLVYGPQGCGNDDDLQGRRPTRCQTPAAERRATPPRDRLLLEHQGGPELLNQYVGETGARSPDIPAGRGDKSEESYPVLVSSPRWIRVPAPAERPFFPSDMDSTDRSAVVAEIDGSKR